ncbi:hypothetical protein BC826DRAFT_529383 [Russula brevipes]|nr:hypothetical protein BC826DRAFT_529383 [Russula brevipes]
METVGDDSSSDSEDFQSDDNAQGRGQGRARGPQRGNDVGGPDPAQRPAHPNYDYGRAPAPEAGRVQVPPQAGRVQVPIPPIPQPEAGRVQVPPRAGRGQVPIPHWQLEAGGVQVVQIPQATVLCGFCTRMTPSEKVRRLGGCCCGCCAQHRRESGYPT